MDAYEDLLFVTSFLDLLSDFHPRDYGRLFFYLGDAIDLDLRVRPLILKSQPGVDTNQLSSPEELRFLRAICDYRYGIFGYPPSVRLVARDARQRTSTDVSETVNAVCRLRPMVRGLMTDMVGRRFIAWDVDQETRRFQTVAFEDLERWIRGLLSGRYIRLRTSFIDVLKPDGETDWETIHFMVAAAENLRTSVQFVKQKRNPRQPAARRTERSVTSKDAHLGTPVTVRDHNKLLIPITIEGGRDVYFGLEEGFFESKAAAPQKHEVREFYRRAPGTPLDAPKTIRVTSHTRGGTIFDDARARMPAVSILGSRRQF
ncbi:hypothetical protein [Paeniglutamicibacter sp. NPDC091659]|uniref:hypothetical protein n=1 Tax=Paeniglutamicibacter sp. NPDC091659 TaxID=3364389 RepID=UPI0038295149